MNTNYFKNSSDVIRYLVDKEDIIRKMVVGINICHLLGGKILIGGNGGSSSDAEHFAGELTCTFRDRNRPGFAAISLTNNSSAITAWANDFSFDSYFSRQVEALGRPGDILFLLSTGGGDTMSGASMNLVLAAETALKNKMRVYSLIGKTGGELLKISHEYVLVESFDTSHIQEAHIAIIHAICLLLEDLPTVLKA